MKEKIVEEFQGQYYMVNERNISYAYDAAKLIVLVKLANNPAFTMELLQEDENSVVVLWIKQYMHMTIPYENIMNSKPRIPNSENYSYAASASGSPTPEEYKYKVAEWEQSKDYCVKRKDDGLKHLMDLLNEYSQNTIGEQ